MDFSILLVLDLPPDFATSYTPTIEVNPNRNSNALAINLTPFYAYLPTKHSATATTTIPVAIPPSTYHIFVTSL